jgi:NAD(P)-dependent dehydrogenase (short-subunit alcohol dehydrogenase family)
MSDDFTDRVVLVTGSGSGIGRAAAAKFAAAGARVLVADLNEDAARAVASEIAGGDSIACDVSRPGDVQAAIAAAVERFGGLDVLVNNAGRPQVGPLLTAGVDELQGVVDVNLAGVFYGIKFAAPVIAERGGGAIVSTASGAGLRGTPGMGLYAATKAAVINLTQTAALELRPMGIRVNCVCPGIVDTAMLREIRTGYEQLSPVPIDGLVEMKQGRFARPDDIAQAIVELASDRIGFVSGVALPVDNAMSASLF